MAHAGTLARARGVFPGRCAKERHFTPAGFDAATAPNPIDDPPGFGYLPGPGSGDDPAETGRTPPIPEPHTLALLGSGLLATGFIVVRRRRV